MESARGVTTFAVAASTPTQPQAPPTVPIAILGTDAVLAASPATPVQLAYACMRAGFANVIPASWGDELIASAVLRRLPQFGSGPAIQCSCPIVAHRLLTTGGDLRPVLLPLVSPPVAVARYVRTLARPSRARITYIGSCPGAADESIDIRMSPDALIAMLEERDIVLADQPSVFESIIPPDRRRFRSQPGGVPTAEALWMEFGSRTLVELDGDDFVSDLAQHLLTGKNVLIDAGARLGCVCSGAVGGAANPRARVAALEPPRAAASVIEERAPIDLDLPIPAVSRTPLEIVAVRAAPPRVATPPHNDAVVVGSRANSPRLASTSNGESRPSRLSTPVVPRPVLSAFPLARDLEGRALPRAYVARRRSSPKGLTVVIPPDDMPELSAVASPAPTAATRELTYAEPPTPTPNTPELPTAEPASTRSSAPIQERAAEIIRGALEPAEHVATGLASTSTLPSEPIAVEPPDSTRQTRVPVPSPVLVVSDPAFAGDTAMGSTAGEAVAENLPPVNAPPVNVPPVNVPPVNARQPTPRPVVATPVGATAQSLSSAPTHQRAPHTPPRSARPVPAAPAPFPAAPPPTASFSRGQIVLILIAVAAIAICASTVVGVIVSRSVATASLNSPMGR